MVIDRFRLDGKVAVVTGASKNIGLAITRAFAEAGATVIAVARTKALLEERAADVAKASKTPVIPMVADVADRGSIEALVNEVHQRFEQIDVLVNNAYATANTADVPVFEISDEAWEATVAGNVVGPYRISRGFGGRMVQGRGGSIVNILSGSGFIPTPGSMPYGTTKAALWMMTRYMAMEAAPKIRVNAVCPGLTVSDTGGPEMGPRYERLRAMTPMGTVGAPEDVAPAAVYLASDAARFTTGAVIVTNGGRPW